MAQLPSNPELIQSVGGLGLGCWSFGGDAWGGQADDDSLAAMKTALELGIHHFDTAIAYGGGRSERVVGQFIREHDARERIFLASKGNMPDMKPEQAVKQLTKSLDNLNVDAIDLYYIHWPRSNKDMRPVMEQLERMREQGRIKAIGVSNFSVEQMQQVGEVGTVDAHQLCYSLFWRQPEAEIIPYCRENGIAVVTYSSLAQGILTGKFPREPGFPEGDQRPNAVIWFQEAIWPTVHEATERLKALAEREGQPLTHLAIQWALNQPGIDGVLVGARDGGQARENIAALGAQVPGEVLAEMTRISEQVMGVLPADQWNIFGMNP